MVEQTGSLRSRLALLKCSMASAERKLRVAGAVRLDDLQTTVTDFRSVSSIPHIVD